MNLAPYLEEHAPNLLGKTYAQALELSRELMGGERKGRLCNLSDGRPSLLERRHLHDPARLCGKLGVLQKRWLPADQQR